VRLERIPWGEVAAPTEDALRGQLEAEGFDAFVWCDAPGADYQPHSHDHDESLWVIEGEIVFGAEGGEFRLAAGDRLMLPKGTVHTARAGREGARYLIGQK
jgi:quercetin dioxygenase-like cupin family protein